MTANLEAAERGAASVRQARIERVRAALRQSIEDQLEEFGDLFHAYPDGTTVKVDGEFDLITLAEAVDKVI